MGLTIRFFVKELKMPIPNIPKRFLVKEILVFGFLESGLDSFPSSLDPKKAVGIVTHSTV